MWRDKQAGCGVCCTRHQGNNTLCLSHCEIEVFVYDWFDDEQDDPTLALVDATLRACYQVLSERFPEHGTIRCKDLSLIRDVRRAIQTSHGKEPWTDERFASERAGGATFNIAIGRGAYVVGPESIGIGIDIIVSTPETLIADLDWLKCQALGLPTEETDV